MAPTPPEIRELAHTPADLELLHRFYATLYVQEFPDADERESLANMERYLALKQAGWYGANSYHVRLALADGAPVAGVIADYLAGPNAGVIEFLVVAPAARGRGFGRALLADVEAVLAADARAAGRAGLDGIVAELNDPFRRPPTGDSMDPFARVLVWSAWGFRKVDFPYVQPALSEAQQPVDSLMIAWRSIGGSRDEIATPLVTHVMHEYLRWAMRVERPDDSPEFKSMRAYLAARERVALIPLDHYIGQDASRPLAVHEIVTPADPGMPALRDLYTSTFIDPAVAVDAESLGRGLQMRAADGRYHLWAVRATAGAPLAGLATFFTFPEAGFGGYVVLAPPLRGTGRLRLLLSRMEAQMVRDGVGAPGWYVECADDSAPVFRACGFHEVAVEYRSPPLHPGGAAASLHLLYKDFGRTYDPPTLSRDHLLAAMRRIFHVVYGIDAPTDHPLYQSLAHQVAGATSVPFVTPREAGVR